MHSDTKAILVGCVAICVILIAFNIIPSSRPRPADMFAVASKFAPAPVSPIEQNYYLRGDGTWAATAMSGATATAAGSGGFVPPPAAGTHTQFLRGDGTWQNSAAPFFYTSNPVVAGQVVASVGGVCNLVYSGSISQLGGIASQTNSSSFLIVPGNIYKCTAGFSYLSTVTNAAVSVYFWDNVNSAQLGNATTTVPVPVMMGKYLSMGTTTLAYIPLSATPTNISIQTNAPSGTTIYSAWMSVEVV